MPVSRKESMQWVSDEFANKAGIIYEKIGCPDLKPKTGWAVFSQMEEILAEELEVNAIL